jgi:hypothetical protein
VSPGQRVPPGWPDQVRPPGSPDWQRSAVGWLLDHCPAEYRGYPVLSRHPAALVHLAVHHVRAQLQGNRQALAEVRTRLRELAPPALAEVVEVLEIEQVRLQSVARGLTLVGEALHGRRFVPRL